MKQHHVISESRLCFFENPKMPEVQTEKGKDKPLPRARAEHIRDTHERLNGYQAIYADLKDEKDTDNVTKIPNAQKARILKQMQNMRDHNIVGDLPFPEASDYEKLPEYKMDLARIESARAEHAELGIQYAELLRGQTDVHALNWFRKSATGEIASLAVLNENYSTLVDSVYLEQYFLTPSIAYLEKTEPTSPALFNLQDRMETLKGILADANSINRKTTDSLLQRESNDELKKIERKMDE